MASHFTTQEATQMLSTTIANKRVYLTKREKRRLLKKLHSVLGTDNYFVVKATLWELLKHLVAHSPDGVEKWMSVRWLLSELAKFAQEDFGKEISGSE